MSARIFTGILALLLIGAAFTGPDYGVINSLEDNPIVMNANNTSQNDGGSGGDAGNT